MLKKRVSEKVLFWKNILGWVVGEAEEDPQRGQICQYYFKGEVKVSPIINPSKVSEQAASECGLDKDHGHWVDAVWEAGVVGVQEAS